MKLYSIASPGVINTKVEIKMVKMVRKEIISIITYGVMGRRGSSRSCLDAGLVISHVEPSGPITKRLVSSDNKGEWKIRELRKHIMSTLELIWYDRGDCNVYYCAICKEVLVANFKVVCLPLFNLKFSD